MAKKRTKHQKKLVAFNSKAYRLRQKLQGLHGNKDAQERQKLSNKLMALNIEKQSYLERKKHQNTLAAFNNKAYRLRQKLQGLHGNKDAQERQKLSNKLMALNTEKASYLNSLGRVRRNSAKQENENLKFEDKGLSLIGKRGTLNTVYDFRNSKDAIKTLTGYFEKSNVKKVNGVSTANLPKALHVIDNLRTQMDAYKELHLVFNTKTGEVIAWLEDMNDESESEIDL